MSSEFTYEPPNPKGFIQTLREYLKNQKLDKIFDLLTEASCEFCPSGSFSGQRWNAYATTIRFYVPIDKLDEFTNEIQEQILVKSSVIMPQKIGFDLTDIEVSPIMILEEDSLGINTGSLEIKNNYINLFRQQFPLGLPFGLKKPSIGVIPHQGSQNIYFEEEADIGVIKKDAYPNLTYIKLENDMRVCPIGSRELKTVLTKMSQTEHEKTFFELYATSYEMWNQDIPVLIPQAWIQWHSSTKQDLRSSNSSYVNDLYRVDFVAFWNNRRFAILIDDISHYANKNYQYWNASAEKYSMRLKEDRKLRKEGWEVFRVSNWEINQKQLLSEVLTDLREFMNF